MFIKGNSLGFTWHHSNNLHVKGCLFDRSGTFYHGTSVADYFRTVHDESGFREKVREANGCFSVVVETNARVLAAVDRVRTMPLFYAANGDDLLIGDDVSAIQDRLGSVKVDPVARTVFLWSHCSVGSSTLDPRVKQIEAGEFLVYDKAIKRCCTECFFQHAHGDFTTEDEDALVDELDEITTRWVRRLIDSAQGRTLLIPLSGGYDSRYIACALKREGYPKVICYTYGVSDCFERRIAQQVAAQLGYPIHVVEYNRDLWQFVVDSPDFLPFCRFAARRCSIPHLQCLPACKTLHERRAIASDSIIVPGFCGDLQGGSHVPEEVLAEYPNKVLAEGIDQYLLRTNFYLRTSPIEANAKRAILDQINGYTRQFRSDDIESFCSVNEGWFTRQKVAKYVINSLRTYEWFGHEWRLPLWDNEYIEWWNRIPLRFRINSTLYRRFLFERLFEPMGVAFRPPATYGGLRVWAMRWLPLRLIPRLNVIGKKIVTLVGWKPRDVVGFDDVSLVLKERLPATCKTADCYNINSFTAEWYINRDL